jgi:hypothetical protein
MEMAMMRIMGWIAFAGAVDESDPDAAEIALRRAGFTVMRLPAKFRRQLAHPDDDFIIAMISPAYALAEGSFGKHEEAAE